MPEIRKRPAASSNRLAVRKARLSDVDTLLRIEAETFATDALSRRSFRRLVRSPSAAVLVASRDGAPCGYALVLFRRGSRTARLYSIAVAAGETGRGIGSQLLAAAEDAAQKRGAERLRLEVRADNPTAIRLYESRRYSRIGLRENYYEDGMTALLFACPLPRQASSTRAPTRTHSPSRRLRRAA